MANILHLYVFGESKPQHPAYEREPFTCLYHTAGAPQHHDNLKVIAAQEIAAGREAHLHAGETAGRDSYPARPSPELADALRRAGWVVCYAPLPSEREQAVELGVPV